MNQEDLLLRHQSIGYGRNAIELLETCQLFADIERSWKPPELYAFKGRAGINDRVWQRLLAINADRRLAGLVDSLPNNYNALFSLTRYTDEELKDAIEKGIIGPKTSYRVLNNWRKTYGRYTLAEQESLFEELPEVEIKAIYNTESETSQAVRKALDELGKQFPSLKLVHTLPRGAATRGLLPGGDIPKEIGDIISARIDELAGEFLEEAALLDLKKYQLSREEPKGLKKLTLKALKDFLIKVVGSADEFWKRCGPIYQYRIALEVTKADSYAKRDKHFSMLVSNSTAHRLEAVTNEIIELLHREDEETAK